MKLLSDIYLNFEGIININKKEISVSLDLSRLTSSGEHTAVKTEMLQNTPTIGLATPPAVPRRFVVLVLLQVHDSGELRYDLRDLQANGQHKLPDGPFGYGLTTEEASEVTHVARVDINASQASISEVNGSLSLLSYRELLEAISALLPRDFESLNLIVHLELSDTLVDMFDWNVWEDCDVAVQAQVPIISMRIRGSGRCAPLNHFPFSYDPGLFRSLRALDIMITEETMMGVDCESLFHERNRDRARDQLSSVSMLSLSKSSATNLTDLFRDIIDCFPSLYQLRLDHGCYEAATRVMVSVAQIESRAESPLVKVPLVELVRCTLHSLECTIFHPSGTVRIIDPILGQEFKRWQRFMNPGQVWGETDPKFFQSLQAIWKTRGQRLEDTLYSGAQ